MIIIDLPDHQKIWHVVYTRPRAEKKVYTSLLAQEVVCFLPLQKKLRQWKDRKKWVEMPLISGYCFVCINEKETEKVLRINHVGGFVRFEGKPAQIPQTQIDALKRVLGQTDFEIEISKTNFKPGKKVEVIAGPLMGLQGELLSARGKNRFVVRIEQIHTIFSLEIPAGYLTPLPEKTIK